MQSIIISYISYYLVPVEERQFLNELENLVFIMCISDCIVDIFLLQYLNTRVLLQYKICI